MTDDLHELPALALWDLLHRGGVSPTEAAGHYLARIERLNPVVGAFTSVDGDRALDRARALERGDLERTAPLWGMPLGDKELWPRAGARSTFGSRAFADHIAETSHPLVRRLDEAGGVSLGRTNAPEFGMPAYTESRVAPPARNPWAPELGAGGSSGGAAAAVAAGLLPFAPASDGGGSVRIPAASCGLVGLKTTRGLVPDMSGQDSLGGLTVAGPIARTVADAALLADGMIRRRGALPDFAFTLRPPTDGSPLLSAAVRGEGRYQVAVLAGTPWDTAADIVVAPEALEAVALTVRELSAMGHGVDEAVSPPAPDYPDAFLALWRAGAAAIPVEDADALEPLTAWLLRGGREMSATTLASALAALTRFEREFLAATAPFDAVVTPALAQLPRPVGSWDLEDGRRNFEQQVLFSPFTSMINVVGAPAIVLPVAMTADRVPVGVQLVGRPGGEAVLLALGAQLERRLRWGDRRPPVW